MHSHKMDIASDKRPHLWQFIITDFLIDYVMTLKSADMVDCCIGVSGYALDRHRRVLVFAHFTFIYICSHA
jgi:hypothetical protein